MGFSDDFTQLLEAINLEDNRQASSIFVSLENSIIIQSPDAIKQLHEISRPKLNRFNEYKTYDDHFTLISIANLIIKHVVRFGMIEIGMEVYSNLEPEINTSQYDDAQWKFSVSNFYNFSGQMFSYVGQISKSVELFEKSLEIRQELGKEEAIASVLNNLGLAHQNLGELQNANEYFNKTLEIFNKLQLYEKSASVLNNLSFLGFTMGDYTQSLRYGMEGLQFQKGIKNPILEMSLKINIANVLSLQGEVDLAMSYYLDVKERAEQVEYLHFQIMCYRNLGNLSIVKADFDGALRYLLDVLQYDQLNQYHEDLAAIYHAIIVCYVELKQRNQIQPYLDSLDAIPTLSDNSKILQFQKISHAYYLKSSSRLKDRIQAQIEFKQIMEDPVVDHQIILSAMIELSLMLIFEYRTSPNTEVLIELNDLLQRMETMVGKHSMKPIQVYMMLLQSIFLVLNKDIQGSFDLLNQTKNLAIDLGSIKLSILASNYIEYLLPSESSLLDVHHTVHLNENTLLKLEEMMINLKQVGAVDVRYDNPRYISLLIYHKKYLGIFPDDRFDISDHNEISLALAIIYDGMENNAFHNLSYKENSILLYKLQEMIVGVIFAGGTFRINQKFRSFIWLIKRNNLTVSRISKTSPSDADFEKGVDNIKNLFDNIYELNEQDDEGAIDLLSSSDISHTKLDSEFRILLNPFRFELIHLLYTYNQISRKEIMKILNTNSGSLERHLKILTEKKLIETRYELIEQKPERIIYLNLSGYTLFNKFTSQL